MQEVYPVVSLVNGRTVAGATVEPNARNLAAAIDRLHGSALVSVGERPVVVNPEWSEARGPQGEALPSVAVNPAWSRSRDPEQKALRSFVELALA